MRWVELAFLMGGILFFVAIAGFWDGMADWLNERKLKLSRRLKKYVLRASVTNKPWGHEELWAHTPWYAGKLLHINAGHRLSNQYHKKKIETIMVLKGEMNLHLEWRKKKTTLQMRPGDIYHIHEHLVHRMEAVTDVIVVEVSSPYLKDVVRLEDDYGR